MKAYLPSLYNFVLHIESMDFNIYTKIKYFVRGCFGLFRENKFEFQMLSP